MADGDILVGSVKGLTRLDRKFKVTRGTDAYKNVTDIVEYKRDIYVVHERKGTRAVSKLTADLSGGVVMLETPTVFSINKLSVSKTYVVMTDNYNKKLAVYNQSSKVVTGVTVPQVKSPDDVLFLSHASLLVTSYWDKNLVLLDLKTEKIIWSCDQLNGSYSMTGNPSSGLIYVIGYDEKTVYIISPTGMLSMMLISI